MQLRSTLLAASLSGWMALALAPHSFAQCTDDVFEPNDTCEEAADLAFGAYSGLVGEQGSDWYRIAVPAGQTFRFELDLPNPTGQTAAFVTLREEDSSGAACALSIPGLPAFYADLSTPEIFQFRWDSPADESRVYYLEMFFFGSEECVDYHLTLTMEPNACLQTPDNGLEDNDTCDSPVAIGTGLHPGQRVSIADPDYYSVTAAPGELLTVIASGFPAGTLFNFFAWDPAIGCNGSVTAGGAVSFGTQAEVGFYLFNSDPTPRTWTVHMLPTPDQTDDSGFCYDYDLEVRSEGGLCLADSLEPNNDCFNSPTVAAGFYGDLNIRVGDQEHLFVDVPAGATLRTISTGDSPSTSRPMHLYAGCGNSFLASSQFFQSSEKQILTWTNNSGSDASVRLFLWNVGSNFPNDFCPTYSLDIEVSLGEFFCQGNVNSTGFRSRLSALGSQNASTGITSFQANHLPTSQFGLIFFGFASQPPIPFGNGKLCIAGPLLRLDPASTGTGILETDIDWANPGVASTIVSGQQAYFQTWYRDPAGGGAGSNTSSALGILFQ